ncbi:hypothetical protein BTVI_154681 [Pitangus sulphuratus]|nr:hypothetical protein BTVI_154681 [Pitangus sulphuratus]
MDEAGCPPAAHEGPQWSSYPPVAHGGSHAGAGGCLKEAVTPWKAYAGESPGRNCGPMERRAHTGVGLLAGPVTLKQSDPEGLYPMGGIHAAEVHEELKPLGNSHIRKVDGVLSPVGGTPG